MGSKVATEDLPTPGQTYPHRTVVCVTAYVNAAYSGLVWFERKNAMTGTKWYGSLPTADFLSMYDVPAE